MLTMGNCFFPTIIYIKKSKEFWHQMPVRSLSDNKSCSVPSGLKQKRKKKRKKTKKNKNNSPTDLATAFRSVHDRKNSACSKEAINHEGNIECLEDFLMCWWFVLTKEISWTSFTHPLSFTLCPPSRPLFSAYCIFIDIFAADLAF